MSCGPGEEKEARGCAGVGESCAGCPVHADGSVSQQQCRAEGAGHVQPGSYLRVTQGHVKGEETQELLRTGFVLSAASWKQESQGPGEDSASHVESPLLLPPIPFPSPT